MDRVKQPTFAHELTYKFKGLSGTIHRNRLKKIFYTFGKLNIQPEGKLADFGCSNGYIIYLLREHVFSNRRWQFFGFDHDESLLTQARTKQIQDVQFHYINLNQINSNHWQGAFDIVTCFETLEHVGDFRNAFLNIYNACKVGGAIIITVPNEKGIVGLSKYIGRKLSRRNAYGSFFKIKSELKYVVHLILNKDIEIFRVPKIYGWATHLGFDWQRFEKYIRDNYIENKKCELISKDYSLGGFNILYVLHKVNQSDEYYKNISHS